MSKSDKREIIANVATTNHSAYGGFEVEAAGVYRVIQIANKKPYVVISGNRNELTPAQNKEQNSKLLSQIKSAGLYAYEMIGGFEEEYKENGEKKTKHVVENSFFIPFDEQRTLTEFIEMFVQLMREYKQNSILLGLADSYDYKDWSPDKAKFKDEGLKKLEVGGHYFIKADSSFEKVGSKATIQIFDKYGSIAIDPKKNRIIDWVIAGVTIPSSPSGCFMMNRKGLKWFWDSFPEVKASDYEGETKQRAVQKIKDHYRKVGEKI